MPLRGGGGRCLMANTILNFHFDYWNTSLSSQLELLIVLLKFNGPSQLFNETKKNLSQECQKICRITLCVTQLVPFHLSPFFVASDRAGFDKYFQSVLTNTSGLIWQIRGAGHYGGTSVEIAAQLVRSRPIWLSDNPTPAYLIKTDLMKMTFKLSYLIWGGIP